MGCEFAGISLAEHITEEHDCETYCSAEPRCSHYVWRKKKRDPLLGTCGLKYGAVSRTDAVLSIERTGTRCGLLGSRSRPIATTTITIAVSGLIGNLGSIVTLPLSELPCSPGNKLLAKQQHFH